MPHWLAAMFTYFPTGWLIGVFLLGIFVWLVLRTRVYFKKKSIRRLLMLGMSIMGGTALLWYITMSGVYDSEPWIPEPVFWLNTVICTLGIIATMFVIWPLGLYRWWNYTNAEEDAQVPERVR